MATINKHPSTFCGRSSPYAPIGHTGQNHRFACLHSGQEAIEYTQGGETFLVFPDGGVERTSDLREPYYYTGGELGRPSRSARSVAVDWLDDDDEDEDD